MLNVILFRRAFAVPLMLLALCGIFALGLFVRAQNPAYGFSFGLLFLVLALVAYTLSEFRMTWAEPGCLRSRTPFSAQVFQASGAAIRFGETTRRRGIYFVRVVLDAPGAKPVELTCRSSVREASALRRAQADIETFRRMLDEARYAAAPRRA